MQKFGMKIDVQGLVNRLDRDQNGSIDYNEFSRLFDASDASLPDAV